MHTLIPVNKPPMVVANLQGSCGKFGIVIQSQDSLGNVYVGTDQLSMSTTDANGNPADGFNVVKQTSVTNVPSTIIIAPFAGVLYAVNNGAAASVISVTKFPLE